MHRALALPDPARDRIQRPARKRKPAGRRNRRSRSPAGLGHRDHLRAGQQSSSPAPPAKHGSRSQESLQAAHARAEAHTGAQSCRKRYAHSKKKRRACERTARKRYGSRHRAKKTTRHAASSAEGGAVRTLTIEDAKARARRCCWERIRAASGGCGARARAERRGGRSALKRCRRICRPGGRPTAGRAEQPRRRADRRRQGTR